MFNNNSVVTNWFIKDSDYNFKTNLNAVWFTFTNVGRLLSKNWSANVQNSSNINPYGSKKFMTVEGHVKKSSLQAHFSAFIGSTAIAHFLGLVDIRITYLYAVWATIRVPWSNSDTTVASNCLVYRWIDLLLKSLKPSKCWRVRMVYINCI